MPKFKILVQQYVEQIGEFEIEAEDAGEAYDKAHYAGLYDAVDKWEEGDDAYKAEVYAIQDESGELVWER